MAKISLAFTFLAFMVVLSLSAAEADHEQQEVDEHPERISRGGPNSFSRIYRDQSTFSRILRGGPSSFSRILRGGPSSFSRILRGGPASFSRILRDEDAAKRESFSRILRTPSFSRIQKSVDEDEDDEVVYIEARAPGFSRILRGEQGFSRIL